MSIVKPYDPVNIIIIFGGVPISGYADGTFVTITPSAERWTSVRGADGETGRAKSNDYSHEVTITLLSTSESNLYLSGVMTTDRLTNQGALPLQILDKGGTTLFFWTSAWIRQPPDVEYSKEITERAWVFDTSNAVEEVIGGATPLIA